MTKEELLEKYPIGCRVELVHMDDPYNTRLFPGCKGTVTNIDDLGTVFVSWDCGSSLGVVFGVDSCKRIDTVKTVCYGKEQVWDSREDAISFFEEGVFSCEGSERERYLNIVSKLKCGLWVCDDDGEN